ncbi:hypothetical protein C2E21_8498 [Chlorella sorokiniana]|uniref:Uncharacterized protein n=1 Tax=Chlorella sorokiniana TaxID=3076 RepID=A0A2P6TEB9_CHLSO|nr:hypothetical protein C2E21_8498 [Chlorella sorokiniana]|eukprot:PRW20994.1 hypothetical protein C2E21_8498 [Chlorella sorokiniana]
MFTTPFAQPAAGGGSGHSDAGGSDGARTSPATAARAPSGRPPLPPGALASRDGSGSATRKGSFRLSSLTLDEPWHDGLLPLSPSLDNILSATGGSGCIDTRPSMLPSRLLSMTAGRLSAANSFDLNWLLGDVPPGSATSEQGGPPAGEGLPGLPSGIPHPTSAAAAAATAAAAAAAGSLPTSVLLGGSLSGALGGGLPYGGMHAMAAGPLGGAAAYAQRAVPTSQLSAQEKMAVWAAQNAMMAAYHAGSPCPELAAAAAVGNTWGLGAGMPPAFGAPQASALPPFPPMPQVRVCSATPVLRLATQAPVKVSPNPTEPADGAAAEGSGSAGGSAAASAQPGSGAAKERAAA